MAGDEPVTIDELTGWVRRATRRCTELDRLALAVKVGIHLDALGDRLVGEFVEEARKAGASWAQIGAQIGVSKQAAHQRHVSRRLFPGGRARERGRGRSRGREGGSDPFERFTQPVRDAMVAAQQEARDLGHGWIGTEHFALGLAAEPEGVAGTVLRGAGVGVNELRRAVEALIGKGRRQPGGPIPFTPRAKRALHRAVRLAKERGSEVPGTGSLLRAVLEDDGVARQVLDRLAERQKLLERLAAEIDSSGDR